MNDNDQENMINTIQHIQVGDQQEQSQQNQQSQQIQQKKLQQPLKQSVSSPNKNFYTKNHFEGRNLLYEVKEFRELTEEEKRECTFNPQINDYDANTEREGRTVEERLQLQGQEYAKNKEAARRKRDQAIIEQQREQERKLREKIAKAHKNEPDYDSDEPIENKIIKRSGIALQNHKIPNDSFQQFTFTPQINKMTMEQQERLNKQREGKSATEWMYEKGKQSVSKLRESQNDDTIVLRGRDAEEVYREIMGEKPQNKQYKLAQHFEKRQKEMEHRRAMTQEEEQKRIQQETQQYKSAGISAKLQADFDRLKQQSQENRARALEAQQKAEQAKKQSLMSDGSIQLTKSGNLGVSRGEILYNTWKNEIQKQKKSTVAKAAEVEKQLQDSFSAQEKEYHRPQFTQNSTGYHQRIKELERAKNQYKLKQQLKEQKEQEEQLKQLQEEQRLKKIDRYLEKQKKEANQSIEQIGESAKNARKLDTMINGTKRFLNKQLLAASNKEFAERRLNQNLPAWHLEPTRTYKNYKIAEPKRPKEISEDIAITSNMEQFLNMAVSELKNGLNADNTLPQPQKIVQTTTSVLDIAAIGERQKIPTAGGIFTKFHKIAQQIQAQNFDRPDYVKRRIQREQEIQLLSQSLTSSSTFQNVKLGETHVQAD